MRPPTRYMVVGDAADPQTRTLRDAARRLFDPGSLVRSLEPGRDDEAIRKLGLGKVTGPFVAVCSGEQCSGPVKDADGLKAASPSR